MVILGLGSNLGNRAIHLRRAISRLSHGRAAVLQNVSRSPIYESPALTPPGAPAAWDVPYLNCVLSGETDLEPDDLLRHVKAVEISLGRQDHERWAPRVIDIDILWWNGDEVRVDGLVIPHPEILNRSFVLEPLRALMPGMVLEGEAVEVHADRLKGASGKALPPAVHAPESDFEVSYPTLMGILNVTPDSFSDGGLFLDPEVALMQARRLARQGAGIIDVGAESTRPDGAGVDPASEWARLEPVLRGLRELQKEFSQTRCGRPFQISIDSRNPSTVRSALEIGVDLMNDVTGFRDPGMLGLAKDTDVPLVFMHSLSIPVAKGESVPADLDAVEFLMTWAQERVCALDREGIARHRLIFDPGIGFGKTVQQNWHVLEHVERFHDLGVPILIGHSRKSFLEAVTDKPSAERDPETLDVSRGLAAKGVDILRVHDVEGHAALFRRQHSKASSVSAAEITETADE